MNWNDDNITLENEVDGGIATEVNISGEITSNTLTGSEDFFQSINGDIKEYKLTGSISSSRTIGSLGFIKGEKGNSAFEDWKSIKGNENKTFDDFLNELCGVELAQLISYNRADKTVISVGGVPKGSVFEGSIQDALDKLFYQSTQTNDEGLATEHGILMLSESGLILENSTDNGIKISELPLTDIIKGFIPVVQDGETKRLDIKTLGENSQTIKVIHIGVTPPEDTKQLWVDTSTPYNFDISTYDGRMRLKYAEMLELTFEKLLKLEKTINEIESNINKINGEESTNFRIEISKIRNQITNLKNEINNFIAQLNNGVEISPLKVEVKNIRKETKSLAYNLSDISTNVLRVLDGQSQIENDDDDVTTDELVLLTENGEEILTEDGLLILLDGINGDVEIIDDSLLTEDGRQLLTESGLLLILDGVVEDDVILANAILTEFGVVILTENGKQIIKN